MICNRFGDIGRFTIVLGVIAAHDALQLRELANHIGYEVGLGQLSRTRYVGGVSADGVADLRGEILYAQQTIQLCTQFVVIDHIAQFGDTRCQRLLAILREEEAGVRQTWANHALVAADDVLRIGHLHVRHNQELIAQLA